MSDNKRISRRGFLGKSAVAIATVAVGRQAIGTAAAADMPMVDPTSAQAQGLGYVEDATTVDKSKYARYQDGQKCANCQLYGGGPDSEAGSCGIFPGKRVKSTGWCNVYAPKAS